MKLAHFQKTVLLDVHNDVTRKYVALYCQELVKDGLLTGKRHDPMNPNKFSIYSYYDNLRLTEAGEVAVMKILLQGITKRFEKCLEA